MCLTGVVVGETSADPLRLQEREPAGRHRISPHHAGAGPPAQPGCNSVQDMINVCLMEDVHD